MPADWVLAFLVVAVPVWTWWVVSRRDTPWREALNQSNEACNLQGRVNDELLRLIQRMSAETASERWSLLEAALTARGFKRPSSIILPPGVSLDTHATNGGVRRPKVETATTQAGEV